MSIQYLSWAYKQTGLSVGAKFLLVTLANYANHDGVSWPGQETLSADTGATSRSIRKWSLELSEAGLVQVTFRQGDGHGRKSNLYQLRQPEEYSGRGQPEPDAGQPERGSAYPKDKPSVCLLGEAEKKKFAQAWKAYPKREGGNSKAAAQKAWNARIRQGVTPEEMAEGLDRYTQYLKAKDLIGTQWVKQASAFFGTAKHYAEEWEVAPPKPKRNGSGTAEDVGRAYQAEFGKPPPPGKTTDEVRAMISQKRERQPQWYDS